MPRTVRIFKCLPLFHQLVGLYLTLPWIDILPFYILKREDKRWFGFSLYEKNVSRGELPCTSPSNLSDGYTKKEDFMTTTARGAVRERAAEERGGAEQERPFEGIQNPLLLAALMARREEGEGLRDQMLPALVRVLRTGRDGREEAGRLVAVLVARHALRAIS